LDPQTKHSIGIIALCAILGGAVLYFTSAAHDREVVELRKQLEQARAEKAEAEVAAKNASISAVESALGEARAMAQKAAAERAAAEKAATEARAMALAAQRAAAEVEAKAAAERARAAEARATAARERAAEVRAIAERAAAERAAAEEYAAKASGIGLYEQALALEQEGRGRDAVKLYVRAARSGNGKAAKRLGEIYDKGLAGVSRDYAESLKWYNAARVLGEDVPMRESR
jgi:colicin import membrane protein